MSCVRVPPELLERYGTRGPRYTSYPTAPHFREDEDRDRLEGAWRESSADLSLYAHLPFCEVRCLFCGCHVEITRRHERATDYVDRVLAELDLCGRLIDLARPLRQLHLGGGTPNFLTHEQMTRLIRGVEERCDVAADAERAIECDPRVLDAEYVSLLHDLGFNRFSLGVQDLDPRVMAAVNRPQSRETIEQVVEALRSRGPVPINFDLIHGLPGQTLESWSATLEAVVALRPSRLAVYAYAHVPWMKKHQTALERHGLPEPELRAELAELARLRLGEAGYVAIGFDHHALPDDELARAAADGTLHRNFMGYTTRRGLDQVAVGSSAISHVGRSYTQDEKDLRAWTESVESARLPWARGLVLSEDDVVRGDVITELTCNAALDFAEIDRRHGGDFERRFGNELERLRVMEHDGLLRLADRRIDLTDVGRYLVRNVCMVFDAWLPRDADAATPRYSRTV